MSFEFDVRVQAGSLQLAVQFASAEQVLAVVGPNGSGKTTLLRTIAGAVPGAEGRIRVGGATLLESSQAIDVAIEERRIGYVPQGYGLFPHLSVRENLEFGLRHVDSRSKRARCEAMLATLELRHLAERRPARLSGGEQQRVALARALVIEPQVLLLDEPLAALDVQARRSTRAYLAEHLRATHIPTIFVTHDVRDAQALEAPLVVLEQGRVTALGQPEALRQRSSDPFVLELLGA